MKNPILGPEQLCSADATLETLLLIHRYVLGRAPGGAAALEEFAAAPDSWDTLEQISDRINDQIAGMDLWFGVDQNRMVAITEMGADYYRDVTGDFRDSDEELTNLMTPTAQERLLNHYILPELLRNPEQAEQLRGILRSLGSTNQLAEGLAELISRY